MDLLDFSDEDEDAVILGTPCPKPLAPSYEDGDEPKPLARYDDMEDGESEPRPLTSLVQAQYEEDEDDGNEQDYEPQYSRVLVRRAATRMKGSATGGAKQPRKRKKKVKGAMTIEPSLISHADANNSTENQTATKSDDSNQAFLTAQHAMEAQPNIDEEDEVDYEGDGDEYDDDGDYDNDEDDDNDGEEDEEENYDGDGDEFAESNEELLVIEPELIGLRAVFDQCVTILAGRKEVGADRLLLVNALRFDLQESELADEVLVLQSQYISWPILAGLYILHGKRVPSNGRGGANVQEDELDRRLPSPSMLPPPPTPVQQAPPPSSSPS
jgi:hypothetical protein